MTHVPLARFNNDFAMPQVGFGMWALDDQTEDAVRSALDAGYRSFDTAAVLGTEEVIGRVLLESGLPREELFVTTKVWNADQGYDSTLRAFDKSQSTLGLNYVDLYLVHWPVPSRDLYMEAWKALERIYADGRVKAIGVSNFEIAHLQRVLDETSVVPAVNVIELHPRFPQNELRHFHARHGIATQAWNQLGQPHHMVTWESNQVGQRKAELLDNPLLRRIAEKHGRSTAQVMLRWHVQLGNLVTPKSYTPARIKENIDIFDFELDAEDLTAITGLDTGERMGPHPDTFDLVAWME